MSQTDPPNGENRNYVDIDSDMIDAARREVEQAKQTNPSDDTAGAASPGSGGWNLTGPPPDSFVGYNIVREIHRGGQGVVYQAIQKATKRKVAIKVMKEGPFASQREKARFDREVEILGQLKHPNIVTIHDSGTAGGTFYFVMDYISGGRLDAWLADGEHPFEETLRLFAKICEAVNAAHVRGIIHRDLKPSNIHIDQNGEPHVLDFGLAKASGGMSTEAAHPQAVTLTGQFMGSLPWASPEQAEAIPSKVDMRTDVYSLGVILYQMLTGKFPYKVAGKMQDVLNDIINADPKPPSTFRRQINDEIETIVLKCLQKERDRRYQSAGDLARDIGRYLAGEPIEARRNSVFYLLHIRTSGTVRKHPFLTGLFVVVFATLLTHYAVGKKSGEHFLHRWSRADLRFLQLAYQIMPASETSGAFGDVRVISLNDETDMEQIAAQAGIDAACLRDDPRCFRQVHGQLMKRLAAADPAVIAWDIIFTGDSGYDDTFVAGVEALRDAGCPVIITAGGWQLSSDGLPPLSMPIQTVTRWGCTSAQYDADTPWRIPLVIRRGVTDPLPSLAIKTFAAYRRPGAEVDLRLNSNAERLTVLYWRRSKHVPHTKVVDDYDEIPLGVIHVMRKDIPPCGIRRHDVIGHLLLRNLPSDDALQAATDDYGDVFSADPDELRRAFADKIVIFGEQRGGQGMFNTPDGRRLWSTYAHAAAVDILLRGSPVRLAGRMKTMVLTTLAAVLGAAAGWFLFRIHFWFWLVLAFVILIATVLSFWGVWHRDVVFNPLNAVLALFTASGLSWLAHSMYLFRRN